MMTVKQKPFYLLWIMVTFFAIVIAVNIAFVVISVRTNRGVVDEHAYEHGLKYNDVIRAAAEKQKKHHD